MKADYSDNLLFVFANQSASLFRFCLIQFTETGCCIVAYSPNRFPVGGVSLN